MCDDDPMGIGDQGNAGEVLRFTRYGQDTEEGRQGGAVGSGAATLSGGAR